MKEFAEIDMGFDNRRYLYRYNKNKDNWKLIAFSVPNKRPTMWVRTELDSNAFTDGGVNVHAFDDCEQSNLNIKTIYYTYDEFTNKYFIDFL